MRRPKKLEPFDHGNHALFPQALPQLFPPQGENPEDHGSIDALPLLPFQGVKPVDQGLPPILQGEKPDDHGLEPIPQGENPDDHGLEPMLQGEKPDDHRLKVFTGAAISGVAKLKTATAKLSLCIDRNFMDLTALCR